MKPFTWLWGVLRILFGAHSIRGGSTCRLGKTHWNVHDYPHAKGGDGTTSFESLSHDFQEGGAVRLGRYDDIFIQKDQVEKDWVPRETLKELQQKGTLEGEFAAGYHVYLGSGQLTKSNNEQQPS